MQIKTIMLLTSHAMLNDSLRASKQTICLQFVYRTHDAAMADRLLEKCQNFNESKMSIIVDVGKKLLSFIDFLPFFITQVETNNQYYYFEFYTETDWFIEIFPYSKPPDTDLMQKAGMTPTRLFMDGDYVQSPESPGLYARNRLVR